MMTKIDTSGWKEFVIEDLFEKLQLDIKNESFNKHLMCPRNVRLNLVCR